MVVPNLSVIAAMADNRVIGVENRLPWRLPADLQHFKRLTMGKPIVMGRRTWESLPGLLPGRTHVVVTRNNDYRAPGAVLLHSLEEALTRYADEPEIMLVGGAELYRQSLPMASRLYLTEVHIEPEGDAFFPDFDRSQWRETGRVPGDTTGEHAIPHTFVTLERRPPSD